MTKCKHEWRQYFERIRPQTRTPHSKGGRLHLRIRFFDESFEYREVVGDLATLTRLVR